jgi:uncharacterized RDD family membrane protein YckC
MPLTFTCPQCNQQITVHFPERGDRYTCRLCGAVDIVPESAVEVEPQVLAEIDPSMRPESWRVDRAQVVLASRADRLLARLIDAAIAFAVFLVTLGIVFGIAAIADRSNAVGAGLLSIITLIGGQLVFWIVQGWYLSADGQSLGKKAMKIRVVTLEDYRNGGVTPNFLVRELANNVLSATVIWFFFDSLLIFSDDRRCIHDHMAGTIVVEVRQQ